LTHRVVREVLLSTTKNVACIGVSVNMFVNINLNPHSKWYFVLKFALEMFDIIIILRRKNVKPFEIQTLSTYTRVRSFPEIEN